MSWGSTGTRTRSLKLRMLHLPIDRNHETGHQKPKHVNMHSGQVGKVKIQGQQRREHALVARIQRKGSRRCEVGYNARCARTQQFHTRLPTTSAPLMILGTIDGVPSSKMEQGNISLLERVSRELFKGEQGNISLLGAKLQGHYLTKRTLCASIFTTYCFVVFWFRIHRAY